MFDHASNEVFYFHLSIRYQAMSRFGFDIGAATMVADEFVSKISGTNDANYVSNSSGLQVVGWVRDGELLLFVNIVKDYEHLAFAGDVPTMH